VAPQLLGIAVEEERTMALKKECTLLELVQSVSEVTSNDEEVVATVTYLVNSGRVRLCGNFAGAKIAVRPSLSAFLNWVRTPQPALSA
jgi:fatty acid-binding protein DegV